MHPGGRVRVGLSLVASEVTSRVRAPAVPCGAGLSTFSPQTLNLGPPPLVDTTPRGLLRGVPHSIHNATLTLVTDQRVNGGRFDRLVAHQFLNRSNVARRLARLGGKPVT